MIVEFDQKYKTCTVKGQFHKTDLEIMRTLFRDKEKDSATVKFHEKHREKMLKITQRLINFQIITLNHSEEIQTIYINVFKAVFVKKENSIQFILNSAESAKSLARIVIDLLLEKADDITKKSAINDTIN